MLRYGPEFHHGVGIFGWLFLALVAALVIVGVVMLVVTLIRPRRGPQGRLTSYLAGSPLGFDPALAELRMRYARGEISWEEFALRSGNLGHPHPPGMAPPGPPSESSPPPPAPS